jgi:hypothetical protein
MGTPTPRRPSCALRTNFDREATAEKACGTAKSIVRHPSPFRGSRHSGVNGALLSALPCLAPAVRARVHAGTIMWRTSVRNPVDGRWMVSPQKPISAETRNGLWREGSVSRLRAIHVSAHRPARDPRGGVRGSLRRTWFLMERVSTTGLYYARLAGRLERLGGRYEPIAWRQKPKDVKNGRPEARGRPRSSKETPSGPLLR